MCDLFSFNYMEPYLRNSNRENLKGLKFVATGIVRFSRPLLYNFTRIPWHFLGLSPILVILAEYKNESKE